jgi:hypothetical protein
MSIEPLYFFEVDLSHTTHINTITIGYTLCRKSRSNNDGGDVKSDLLQTLDTCFLCDLKNKNSDVLGCGLTLHPTKSLFLTKGTRVIWEAPLLALNKEMFLDLIPFVSVTGVEVNVGQKCFVYEPANTNKCKQKFLSLVLDLIDKEDG